ncbi:hypothetical protein [Dietzia kunjamensis]|uniref:hypothetical protein n=1 Tax=Dietzia kunjamensis TaxID=322509 RepID=UPI0020984E03|nr:hypothetical protein [Dietzia kunjamensis]USX47728.1 hypothetical protein NHB83_01530 [Dietzia kunjamensis]
MSTTINPVRHIADVAVNSAAVTLVAPPDATAAGSSSNPVPTAIAAAKLRATTRTGLNVAQLAHRLITDGDTRPYAVTRSDSRPRATDEQ